MVPSSASAQLDLVEFQSAVEAMQAVDPTLEPPPNDSKHDLAVGGFQVTTALGDAHWGVSAHSGPMGEDPWGHVSATSPVPVGPGFLSRGRWRVVCLAVFPAVGGTSASLGLEPTDARLNDFGPGKLDLRDSSSPGVPDQAFFFPGAPVCGPPSPVYFIVHGNIVIRDAQP